MIIPVVNPRTGLADCTIECLDEQEVAKIARGMRAKQPDWAKRSHSDRATQLIRMADAITRHQAVIVEALTRDTGRAALSVVEFDSVVRTFRRWANSAPALIEGHQSQGRATAIQSVTTATHLIPYQLVGVISPWNFPLTLALIDAIPALAAGCAVLIKPSEVTPRFISPLRAAIAEVPEVEGVFEFIEGDAATGAALVDQVDFIVFTGSVATGRRVAEAAAHAFIPASLELGGKDPLIVLETANVDQAAKIVLRASVLNNGQACQSIERVYVARTIAPLFTQALVEKAKTVRLNYPDIHYGDIGPFILARQADIVQRQIDEAVANGARLLCGGTVETLGGGRYLRPTVLVDVTPDMAIMHEETFGPVIPVTVFDSEGEAIELANRGEFGLSAAVIAGSIEEAEQIGLNLNVGAVSINDGSLTGLVWDVEKSSFGSSGIGPSRMGDSGLLRFLRHRLTIRQAGHALTLSAYAEDSPHLS
ncbi:MAG: aldehyde dehydrogenase family protein [Tsuneonella sp.]